MNDNPQDEEQDEDRLLSPLMPGSQQEEDENKVIQIFPNLCIPEEITEYIEVGRYGGSGSFDQVRIL